MNRQESSGPSGLLIVLVQVLLFSAHSSFVWADRWMFTDPVEIVSAKDKVFHHIESSGRQNISAGENGIAIVWEDNRSGRPEVYLAIAMKGAAFRPAIKVSGGGEAYEPVVQEFRGGWIIGWEEDGHVRLRAHAAGELGTPLRLSERRAGQINLTTGNSDELLAVWSATGDKFNRIVYAGLELVDGGLRVTKKAQLDIKPGQGDQNFPVVAYHEAMGTYVAMWEDRRYQNVMLFSAMGTIENGFSVGMQVNELRAPISGFYGVASGVARGALAPFKQYVAAVWSDKRNFRFGYEIFSAFARHSGRFGENTKVQDGFADGYEQWHPTIAARGDSLAVAWDDDRDGNSDIWLSYYTQEGWSDDIAVPGASGEGIQTHPSLAIDPSGALHLIWVHRSEEGGPTGIYYLRGEAKR